MSVVSSSNYPWGEVTDINFTYNTVVNGNGYNNLTLNITTDYPSKIYVLYGQWGVLEYNTLAQYPSSFSTNNIQIIEYVDQSKPIYFGLVIANLTGGIVKFPYEEPGYSREEYAWCSNNQQLTDYTKFAIVSVDRNWVDYTGFPFERPIRQPRPEGEPWSGSTPKYNISWSLDDFGTDPVYGWYIDYSVNWQVDLVSSFGCTGAGASFWTQPSILEMISSTLIASPQSIVSGQCDKNGCVG